MKFKTEVLRDLVWEDGSDNLFIASDRISGKSRWAIIHDLVFGDRSTATTHYYRIDYRVGATENQDETPFEYAGEELECQEVWPHETISIEYRPVRPGLSLPSCTPSLSDIT